MLSRNTTSPAAKPVKFYSVSLVSVLRKKVTPKAKMYTLPLVRRSVEGIWQFSSSTNQYKPTAKTAVVISARDMSDKERKAYGRK